MAVPFPDTETTRFTERAFRDELGLFPTGVAVVTATTESGDQLGLTVSSFTSVSLKPPLVSFSVTRATRSFREWQHVPRFAINVLDQNQQEISNHFARIRDNRLAGLEIMHGETGAPLLMNALAIFECVLHAHHDGGDHEIFIGRVVSISSQTRHRGPLVFFRGRYCRLDLTANTSTPPDDALFMQGGAWSI